ncbi:MAG: Ig-like domain-containing protein [Pseudomonadota bacterium]
MKTHNIFLTILALLMLACPLGGCDSESSDNGDGETEDAATEDTAAEETVTGHSIAISAPAADAVVTDTIAVAFELSDAPDSISVMLGSEEIGRVTSDPMEFSLDPAAYEDGAYELGAVGTWGDTTVESETVPIIIDSDGPVFDTESFLTFSVVSGENAEIPLPIIDGAGLRKIEIFKGGDVISTITEDPFLPVFDSTPYGDSVISLMMRVTDLSGRTVMSDEIPLIAMNSGSIVQTLEGDSETDWDEWSIFIPDPIVGDLHLKYHWNMPLNVTKILTVAVVTSGDDWTTTYAVGEGGCPHSGTQHKSNYSERGVNILELSASELGESMFPTGTWFAHIAQENMDQHLDELFSFRHIVILIGE